VVFPKFRPDERYVREMTKYGILPAAGIVYD